VVRLAGDPELVLALTRHAADEADHARQWAETIHALGGTWVRILRSYQSYYADAGILPTNLAEALALTHVFERRVWRQFQKELSSSDWPPAARSTFELLLAEERGHLEWVKEWLDRHERGSQLVQQYTAVDEQVYERLLPHESALWEVPGLGIELTAVTLAGCAGSAT
jgi:bacterioferritin (cytochrome b1)